MSVLGEFFVHVATIRHPDDAHDEFRVLDFIENPDWALANPITWMPAR